MSIIVTITADGVKSYPQHIHKTPEIAYYLEGEGHLKTPRGDIPFSKGTVIVIPAGVKHGSVSSNPYKNICVHTDDLDFPVTDFLVGKDNLENDLKKLAELTLRLSLDKTENGELFDSVFTAYKRLVFNALRIENGDVLAFVKEKLTQNLSNSFFSFRELATDTGYSENHLRTIFTRRYGVTPNAYLTQIRMSYAKNLFALYGDKLKICEIAWRCGYQDPLYFSKVFKKTYGVSPRTYKGN